MSTVSWVSDTNVTVAGTVPSRVAVAPSRNPVPVTVTGPPETQTVPATSATAGGGNTSSAVGADSQAAGTGLRTIVAYAPGARSSMGIRTWKRVHSRAVCAGAGSAAQS